MSEQTYGLVAPTVQGIKWTGDNTSEVIEWLTTHNANPTHHPKQRISWEEKRGGFFSRKTERLERDTIPFIQYEGYIKELGANGFYNLYVNDIAIYDDEGRMGKIFRDDAENYAVVIDI